MSKFLACTISPEGMNQFLSNLHRCLLGDGKELLDFGGDDLIFKVKESWHMACLHTLSPKDIDGFYQTVRRIY